MDTSPNTLYPFKPYETVIVSNAHRTFTIEADSRGEAYEVVVSSIRCPQVKATFTEDGFRTEWIGFFEWSDFLYDTFDGTVSVEVEMLMEQAIAAGEIVR